MLVLLSSLGFGAIEYHDDFNRPDSTTIGNGWVEDQATAGGPQIENGKFMIWDVDASNDNWVYRAINITDGTSIVFDFTLNNEGGYWYFGLSDTTQVPWTITNVNLVTAIGNSNTATDFEQNFDPNADMFIASFTNGTTHRVNYSDFDTTAETFDLCVDGTCINDEGYMNSGTAAYIAMFTNNGFNDGSIKIDNICVFTPPTTYEDCFAAAPPASSWHTPVFPSTAYYVSSNISGYEGFNVTGKVGVGFNGSSTYSYSIPDFRARYSFENAANDTYGNFNGTINGPTSGAARFGKGYVFDGTNDRINISRHPYLNFTTNSMSISAWIKLNELGYAQAIACKDEGSAVDGSGGYCFYVDSKNRLAFYANEHVAMSTNIDRSYSNATVDTNWHHVVAVYPYNDVPRLYLDSVHTTNNTDNDDVSEYSSNYALNLGSTSTGGAYLNGTMDEVRIYNRSLTQVEITNLYQYGNVNPKSSCELWETVNSTSTLYDSINNITMNKSFDYTLNYTALSTEWEITLDLDCWDYFYTEDDFGTDLNVTMFVDVVLPDMWLNDAKEGTLFVNNSLLYENLQTQLKLNLTGNDTNLYYMNLSVLRKNGTSWYLVSFVNMTNIVTQIYTLNLTNYTSDFGNGSYMIDAFSADSHTLQKIEPYDNTKLVDGYDFDNSVKITSPDLVKMTTTKLSDRYSFDMEFTKEQPTITVECNDLKVVDWYGYEGHIICWQEKKWVDFEEFGTNTKVQITRINANKVTVKPLVKDVTKFSFNSIGDLNTNNQKYYFNISESFKLVARDAITNISLTNFTALLYNTTGGLLDNRSTTSGAIYYNVTGNHSINASSTLYVENSTGIFDIVLGENNTIYLIAANSLYLFIYDEQTNTLITDRNATIDVINYENISHTYTTDTGSTFQSGFVAGSYEINYKAENYTARSYYTTISGSDTQLIRLYLLSNLDSTHQYLSYDLVDDSAKALPNGTIKMQRYFISDNAWRTVEMSKSNDEGKGFFFAELYDASYRFVIEYGGLTRKTTAQSKLDTRDLLFSINLLDLGLDHYFFSGDVATSLSYSNTTKVYTYTFNGVGVTDIESGRLMVTKILPQTRLTVCNSTLAGDSGGLTCNLTSYYNTDGTFLAQGFITFTGNNTEYMTETDSRTLKVDYLKFGYDGILLSFITVGTIAFMGLFSPILAVVFALFGFVITYAIGLIYLSPSWIIGLVIVGLIYIFGVRQP